MSSKKLIRRKILAPFHSLLELTNKALVKLQRYIIDVFLSTPNYPSSICFLRELGNVTLNYF